MSFSGIGSEVSRLLAGVRKFETEAVTVCQVAAAVMLEAALERTPVWEGTVARSYVFGVGGRPAAIEKQGIGTGSPGPTNSMPLGAEPRRSANEASARSDMSSVLQSMTRLQDVFMANGAAHADLVDLGAAPSADRARNPGGVSKFAEAAAKGSSGGHIR